MATLLARVPVSLHDFQTVVLQYVAISIHFQWIFKSTYRYYGTAQLKLDSSTDVLVELLEKLCVQLMSCMRAHIFSSET